MPRLSIVIPVRDGAADLAHALLALDKSDFRDFEVIVVDDGSIEPVERITAEFSNVRLVTLSHSLGPATARNRGAAEATSEILVFLDADTMVHPDTLSRMAHHFDSDDSLAALFGSYDDDPTDAHFISQFRNLHHHFIHQEGPTDASTFWAGCGAVRRKAFQDVGGFHQGFSRPSIEDIEFGSRLHQQGATIRLDPLILVTHRKRWTLVRTIVTDVRDRALPWTRLILEGKAHETTLNLNWTQRYSAALVFFVTLLTVSHISRNPIPILAAFGLLPVMGIADHWSDRDSIRPIFEILFALAMLAISILFLSTEPLAGLITGIMLGTIVFLNRRFYRFLSQRHGLRFAVVAHPLHLLYYLYASSAYAWEFIAHFFRQQRTLPWYRTALFPSVVLTACWLLVVLTGWNNDGLWFQGDAPRHALTGFFWFDLWQDVPLNPMEYAKSYYARYPAINPAGYPPLYHWLIAVSYAWFGPTPYSAKGVTLLSLFVMGGYAIVWQRRWHGLDWGTLGVLCILAPSIVVWSQSTMPNVPCAAFQVMALFHWRRVIETRHIKNRLTVLLAVSATVAAILTHFTGGIVLFIVFAWWICFKRTWQIRRRHTMLPLLLILATVPFLSIFWTYARQDVEWLFLDTSQWTSWNRWCFYWQKLPSMFGWPLCLLAGMGGYFGLVRVESRRSALWLAIWLGVTIVVFTMIEAQDTRYVLALGMPFAGLASFAINEICGWSAKCFGPHALWRFGWSAICVTVSSFLVWHTRLECIDGYASAVGFLRHQEDNDAIFYDGFHGAVFTYYLRAQDPSFDQRVVLGQKLLYAYAKVPGWKQVQFVNSPESALDAIIQCGARWLVIERRDQLPPGRRPMSVDSQDFTMLRSTVNLPDVEFVKSFTIRDPWQSELRIYRIKSPVPDVEVVSLPMPTLGDGVKFHARPVERRHSHGELKAVVRE